MFGRNQYIKYYHQIIGQQLLSTGFRQAQNMYYRRQENLLQVINIDFLPFDEVPGIYINILPLYMAMPILNDEKLKAKDLLCYFEFDRIAGFNKSFEYQVEYFCNSYMSRIDEINNAKEFIKIRKEWYKAFDNDMEQPLTEDEAELEKYFAYLYPTIASKTKRYFQDDEMLYAAIWDKQYEKAISDIKNKYYCSKAMEQYDYEHGQYSAEEYEKRLELIDYVYADAKYLCSIMEANDTKKVEKILLQNIVKNVKNLKRRLKISI